ncbi:LTA synthase family protein, partial [Enterococcus faecalis]
ANDMKRVEDYVKQQYAARDDSKFRIGKGKNVIYIHLESFQLFLVNYKLKDENGVEHEITPFINSLYNTKSTFSFDNFFH